MIGGRMPFDHEERPFFEAQESPFFEAQEKKRKIKLFLWGSWGTGKTTLSLQFPKPVMLDLDGGAGLYGEKYKYSLLQTCDIARIKNAVAWLLNTPGHGGYETLIIDPITIYWELVQKYWSNIFIHRLTGAKANKHEFFELGPKEWSTIKSDFKVLFTKLIELDMHVIVTARESVKYKAGGFMIEDGVKADAEKSVPYIFDIVLFLSTVDGKYYATCSKDRTGKIPQGQQFECSYKVLEKYLGEIL